MSTSFGAEGFSRWFLQGCPRSVTRLEDIALAMMGRERKRCWTGGRQWSESMQSPQQESQWVLCGAAPCFVGIVANAGARYVSAGKTRLQRLNGVMAGSEELRPGTSLASLLSSFLLHSPKFKPTKQSVNTSPSCFRY